MSIRTFCLATIAIVMASALAGCDDDDHRGPASTSTPTASSTATTVPTNTPTATSAASATQTMTATRVATATIVPSASPTLTATQLPSSTPLPTASATVSATPTEPPLPPTATATVRALPAGLSVAFAKRDISPNATVAPPNGSVFLGGYGLGPTRRSTGVLAPIYVRAMVIADGERAVAFAETDTQGMFAAYQQARFGAVGLVDMALEVERITGGTIAHQNVIIGSDHSHAGPDAIGVWGGLRPPYYRYIHDQVVGAILDAFNQLEPAQLRLSTVDATELMTSQFHAPPNDQIDGEMRVLAATNPDDPQDIRGLMVNWATHSTVMGEGNTLVSGDWPAATATKLEQQLGVDSVLIMLADCGRTQPRDGNFSGADDYETLDNYSNAVVARVNEALTTLQAADTGSIAAAQLFVRERYTNPLLPYPILASLVHRDLSPPWGNVDVVGTLVSAIRVGNLLFTGVPGEGYPEIQFRVEENVPAQEHFIFGLANDQLGYLIAPQEGYEQVKAAAPGNDNALFNVSPEIGDHVMCKLLKASREIGFTLPDDPDKCAAWADENNALPY